MKTQPDKTVQLLTKKAAQHARRFRALREEINRVIVGQEEVIEKVLIALIAGGHVLLEGVPGLAKTLLVRTLAACFAGDFVRLQFTPDLLPADIVGTKIYDRGTFKTVPGPVFANFVLADEINRAPPKVQSALLEAMQERQVSIQGDTLLLPEPFLVLATQNPIESEGTYKLPEAQVDRFMFKLLMAYPRKEDEVRIIERFTEGSIPEPTQQMGLSELVDAQVFCQAIYADHLLKEYAAAIVDATRHPAAYGLDGHVEYGASPRASLWLILAAKARALLDGRGFAKPEDIRAVAHDVLRHRVILTYEAEAEGETSDGLIDRVLDAVPVP